MAALTLVLVLSSCSSVLSLSLLPTTSPLSAAQAQALAASPSRARAAARGGVLHEKRAENEKGAADAKEDEDDDNEEEDDDEDGEDEEESAGGSEEVEEYQDNPGGHGQKNATSPLEAAAELGAWLQKLDGRVQERLPATDAHPVGASRRSGREIGECVRRYADGLDAAEDGLGSAIRNHPLKSVSTSSREIIIGAGSGNTGTHSIHSALTQLGLLTWHAAKNKTWDERRGKIRSILKHRSAKSSSSKQRRLAGEEGNCQQKLRNFNYTKLLDSCDAVVDMPTAEVFLELFLSFPKAKVILSTRPAASWVEARTRTHAGVAPPMQEPCGGLALKDFSEKVLERVYELNNDLVRCLVPPEQFFELDFWTDPPERAENMMAELAFFVGGYDTLSHATTGTLPHVVPGIGQENHKHASLLRTLSSSIVPSSPTFLAPPRTCKEMLARFDARRAEAREYFVEARQLVHMGCDLA